MAAKREVIEFSLITATVAISLIGGACGSRARNNNGSADRDQPVQSTNTAQREAKSAESKSVDPAVQSQVEKAEAEKRATLLKDAESALDDTRNALGALDSGNKEAALAALERASGKLDLVVARDPRLALAPVSVNTTVLDVYTTPDAVKDAVKQARDDLGSERVQQARRLVQNLASEADINVTQIPLATYPAAIKAVAPLVDAGKTQEAKNALSAALNTLVVTTYVVPLPTVRAEAMLSEAEQVAGKSNRTEQDKMKVRSLIDATRQELQLAEALGYGTKDSYKPLYQQLDDIRKKTDTGEPGRDVFDKLRDSLKRFKFSV